MAAFAVMLTAVFAYTGGGVDNKHCGVVNVVTVTFW